MKTSDTLAAISPDLVAALGEMEGAAKSANNPHFRSRYANLEAVVDASRDVLAKHSLGVMQGAGHVIDNKLHLTTRVVHTSGEWIESEFSIPLTKTDPQATLAALTYARRGALMAILGMPAVDDDGETAMGRGQGPATGRKADLGPSSLADDFPGANGVKGKSSHAAKKDGTDTRFKEIRDELWGCESLLSCTAWATAHAELIKTMPEAWRKQLTEDLTNQRAAVRAQMAADGEETFPDEAEGSVADRSRHLEAAAH